jgi:hypothetical protein
MNRTKLLTTALTNLSPGSVWNVEGENITWIKLEGIQPSKESIENEISKIQAEWDSKEYQRQRAAEYPPIADYLDGIVKGDQAQIDAYISACQAVKAKYPKLGE